MPINPVAMRPLLFVNICFLLNLALPSYGSPVPNENGVSRPDPGTAPSATPTKRNRKKAAGAAKKSEVPATGTLYTIKSGDNLFKILMREYGLTSRQAERFIEIVRRENNISNFRKLRVGQQISIAQLPRKNPLPPLHAGRTAAPRFNETKPAARVPAQAQVFTLEKQVVPTLRASEVTANVRKVWEKIVPEQKRALAINSDKVSISLDPALYPVLAGMDGGTILVDAEGKISPSIKALIAETDPGLRIVQGSAGEPKRFLASLIDAGKFYSVEENFTMEFGTDPKLTIHSDFRVEKTAESLVNQDIILLNSGKVATSAKLTEFLKKEGFTVYEPFVLIKPHIFTPRHRLVQVASPAPLDIASTILKALAITAVDDFRVDLKNIDNSGISISITPDRYFEYKGKSYCITYLKDTPVHTNLNRLLETRGINSIILDQKDDFRKVSERILTSVGLTGKYGFHSLWPEEGAGYSLQMSGIMVDGAGAAGESLFLTDREIDRIIKDISIENGFIVQN